MTSPTETEAIVSSCEQAAAAGEVDQLGELGYWQAVKAAKSDPNLALRFADRLSNLDQVRFTSWAMRIFPLRTGTWLAAILTLVGGFVTGWSLSIEGGAAGWWLLAGMGILLVSTHGLGHQLVGWMVGIRFTHWFIGSIQRPQPGVKLDFASYLVATPTKRAWMHASGAIVTKAIPFLIILVGWTGGLPGWALWLAAITGVLQILTDIVWSTKNSDWMKYRRELGYRNVVDRNSPNPPPLPEDQGSSTDADQLDQP